ncbi:MAG: hypothetical protein QXY40_01695 [Candidatus Methanomethylicia archaeon]
MRGLTESIDVIVDEIVNIFNIDSRHGGIRPILKIKGKTLYGFEIHDSYFHDLTPTPHDRGVLCVDASVKKIFDLGSLQIICIKVAWGLWRGRNKVNSSSKRVFSIVNGKVEALSLLRSVEAETILLNSTLLRSGDICILDRPLMAIPTFKKSSFDVLASLENKLSNRGIILVGLCKSTQLKLENGESIVGYLMFRRREKPWLYYPVFEDTYPWILGRIVIACFNNVEYAFRVDISPSISSIQDIKKILSYIAYLQDSAYPGYPYPPLHVHNEAKISDSEIEVLRERIVEQLEEKAFLKRFLGSVRSGEFREDILWGNR